MKSNITSKIIPFFYFILGILFLFLPIIPMSDILIDIEASQSNDIIESLHRILGILFLCVAILIYRIFTVSSSLYRLLNSTFIFVFTLLASAGIIVYFGIPSRPQELLLFSGINIAMVFFFFIERKE